MKSAIAFKFSSQLFGQRNAQVYLWTFTFQHCEALADARKLWSLAVKNLVRRIGFRGLRVFELHPGGHGLHVHVVTDTRFDVREVRKITTMYRFGRINVKMIPADKAGYVGKYLSKQRRAPALKGVRLWAAVGGQDAHKVSDIVIDSPFTRAYAYLKETFTRFDESGKAVAGFARWSFHIRSHLTNCFAVGDMRRFSMFLQAQTFAR